MITLVRDERYEDKDTDCTYIIASGDLVNHIKRIGYTTTFDDDTDPIHDEDIKDLYIYACLNEDDNETLIFISIREDWDMIYVERKTGNYVGNTDIITSAINTWVNNN